MIKQFFFIVTLFAVGIGIGAFMTPVGVDWSKEMLQPEVKTPVHQKPHSNAKLKKFYS